MESCVYLSWFTCKGPIENKSVLVQGMAWHQWGNKPLTEPVMIQFTNTYMLQFGEELKKARIYGLYIVNVMASEDLVMKVSRMDMAQCSPVITQTLYMISLTTGTL